MTKPKPQSPCPPMTYESIEKLFDAKLAGVQQSIADLDKRFVLAIASAEKTAVLLAETTKTTAQLLADAQAKATDIAAISLDKRLDVMNEFRATISDQAASYYTRQEHETWARSIEVDLKAVRENFYTKSEHDAYAKGVEGDLRTLRESRAELQGMAKVSQVYFSMAIGIIGAICGIISIILHYVVK